MDAINEALEAAKAETAATRTILKKLGELDNEARQRVIQRIADVGARMLTEDQAQPSSGL